MPLTGTTVRAALAAVGAVGKQIATFDELAAGANSALRAAPAGLTVEGAAAFLATCGQESGYFRTATEWGAERKRYDPYRGRGFVQVTWADNYRAFGKWCKARNLITDPEMFVKTPTALAEQRWVWLTATWYFAQHNLWKWGNRGDFYAVSQGVNRGPGAIGGSRSPHGWPQREAMYRAFRAAGPALLPGPSVVVAGPDRDAARRRRQQALLS